jgi:2-polyprenyl-6-methoxyphenol hydroxylase-like FAD-dependent oxidoreductase
MLLARKGYRVLLVDKAAFPSDVVNGYYVQQLGAARLKRWGLLEPLRASNCPPLSTLTFDFGAFALRGAPPSVEDVAAGYAPRRTVLDKILVDAAVHAGAELREECTLHDLVWDGAQVTGIHARTKGGAPLTEHGRVMIGADGTHSFVARLGQAPTYNTKPALTCWYAGHWSGVPTDGVEFYLRERRALIACGTNDGLTVVLTGWPHEEFHAFRADIEGNYFKTVALVPALAERVRSGKREERFVGTAETANFFRKPYGLGWALVGDAGYHKDPATAQGISDSFRDAEFLTEAIDAGFSERQPLGDALAEYERQRNAAVLPMYEFTCQLANLAEPPAPQMLQLLAALRGNQAETNRFLGTWAGTVPVPEFFAPENIQRIMNEDKT